MLLITVMVCQGVEYSTCRAKLQRAKNYIYFFVEELFNMLMMTVMICKLDDLQGEAAARKERRKKGKEVEEGSEREERKEEG